MLSAPALRSVLPSLGASLPLHAALGCWARAFGSLQGAQQPRPQPRFALAFSDNPSLSLAITECVDQVQSSLGPGVQPDFLQLLVSTDLHLRQMALAPAWVHERFVGTGLEPPVLIGGAVETVMSTRPRPCAGSGVSLLAASLPGVTLFPFHARTTSAPPFTPQQWAQLLQKPVVAAAAAAARAGSEGAAALGKPPLPPGASALGPVRHNLCGLLFVEPHFIEVEEFLSRLHNLLPACQILGGVVQPGHDSKGAGMASAVPGHGSLFLGPESFHEGAVGCLMLGPIELQARVASACRPVGPIMRVTASRGNTVFQLDGIPAVLALRQAIEELHQKEMEAAAAASEQATGSVSSSGSSSSSRDTGSVGSSRSRASFSPAASKRPSPTELPLEVGVDYSGRGLGFLARGLGNANPALGSVQLAVADVPEGALLQLHLLDPRWGAKQCRRQLGALLAPPLPPASSAKLHAAPTNSGRPDDAEASLLEQTLPGQEPSTTTSSSSPGSGSTSGGTGSTSGGSGPGTSTSTQPVLGPGGVLGAPPAPELPPGVPSSSSPFPSSSAAAAAPSSQVLLSFSCTTVANDEPWVAADLAGPEVLLQGARYQGELAPGPGVESPALYSFTSSIGLLRGVGDGA